MALIVLVILFVIVLLGQVVRGRVRYLRYLKRKMLDSTEKGKPQLQFQPHNPTKFSPVYAVAVLGGLFLALCCCICVAVYLWEVLYGPIGLTPSKLMAFVMFNVYMILLFRFHWDISQIGKAFGWCIVRNKR